MTDAVATMWVAPARLDDRLDARAFKPWVVAAIDACASVGCPTTLLGSDPECIFLSRGVGAARQESAPFAVYKAKEVGEFNIRDPEAFTDHCPAKKILRAGDLVLTSSGIGTIGRAALYRDNTPKGTAKEATVDNHVSIIRFQGNQLLSAYVCAFLNSRYGKAWSEWGTTGSTRLLELSTDKVGRFRLPVPDRRIQQYISAKVHLAARCQDEARELCTVLSAKVLALYRGAPAPQPPRLVTVLERDEIDATRLDAWYHQRHFVELARWLRGRTDFVEVSTIATLSEARWNPATHPESDFLYLEIAAIDVSNGQILPSRVDVNSAPSRARKALKVGDLLVSTVRPNRKGIAVVPAHLGSAVASTGFAVLRSRSLLDAYFLELVLNHDISTAQLMRFNTGSTYPAIEEGIILRVRIPGADRDVRKALGSLALRRRLLLQSEARLLDGVKADIDDLIQGKLDTDAIVSRRLKEPTYEDIVATVEAGEE